MESSTLKETADMRGGKGAVVGAVIGGVLGVMAGPGGVIAGGAAGAFIGGLTAKIHDAGIKDDTLRKIGEDLKTGSTAIVVVFDPHWETSHRKNTDRRRRSNQLIGNHSGDCRPVPGSC